MSADERQDAVGFIGLGVMGRPMAGHLVAAGHRVVVHNRSRGAVAELAALGAEPAESAADLAERVESGTVITMLPRAADVLGVLSGEDGVMARLAPGGLVIDMSTIDPESARRLAADGASRELGVLDAPVSGGQRGALEATLSIMCGGDEADVERARPLFDRLGSRTVHVGPTGMGQVVKACNQIMVGITLQAMGEALTLATASGADPNRVVEALLGGAARCWALEARAPAVMKRDFTPGFRCSLHQKDLGIALEAGRDAGVALPVSALVHEFFGALVARGDGDDDHSALIKVVEALSGR